MNHLRPCLVLCKSAHHGNTARVADTIAHELDAEVASSDEVPYTDIEHYQLLGFGSGVYYGRMHEELSKWLCGLPDSPTQALPAFIFSTSGLPWLAWLWHRPLRRLLARKGFRLVGEYSCGGYDSWGPLRLLGGLNRTHPDERDLARAAEFARGLAKSLSVPLAAAGCR
jgi:flavodoxin